MTDSFKVFQTLSKKYSTPLKVQTFLRSQPYNDEKEGETARSALSALKNKKAHCLEASLIGAAILEQQGYPPLILSLDSIDHLNHVLFIFKEKTGWGSLTRSRVPGLHGREPRFRSIRDLAWSYYEPFVDQTGKLVGYEPLDLDQSGTDWRFSKRNLWKLEKFVVGVKYQKVNFSKGRYLKELHRYQREGFAQSGPHWW